MNAFKTMLIVESKLALRSMDGLIFGILFPLGIVILLGIIYGGKPAFDGARYTFLQQSFGAVVAIGICATGLMGLPLTIADYRDKKILKRFRVTPVDPGLLLWVQIAICFIISMLSGVAVFLVGHLLFGYVMEGSVTGFLGAYVLVTAAVYGLGMLLASISPNLKTANLLCTLVYFPMLFLSGATVPYEIMPTGMQRVVDLLPLTQGIKLLKGFSLGLDVGGLLTPLVLMGGLAIICIFASVRLFRWE